MKTSEHGGILLKLIGLLFLLGFVALLYAVRHPLLRTAGRVWVVSDPIEQADAIVVLGDDNFAGDRAAHAAELFRRGVAGTVVASGRLLRPYAGMAEIVRRDLVAHGVPEAAIVTFDHSAGNTRDEAVALRTLLVSRGWKRVLIVTSNYHARRAGFIFRRVLGADITVRVSAAGDSEFQPVGWWRTRTGQKLFLNEVLGYLAARWELRHLGAWLVFP
jgi:uncharacterized SAM-binding protein YcdF (DUF218 family)